MAATIVAGVCEDHQDYELMEPSTTKNPKKGHLTPKQDLSQHISSILKLSSTPVQ